jgi:hypothetical protein
MRAACPHCHTALDGGPIVYRCAHCHRSVQAADLDVEHHAPRPVEVTVCRPGHGAAGPPSSPQPPR